MTIGAEKQQWSGGHEGVSLADGGGPVVEGEFLLSQVSVRAIRADRHVSSHLVRAAHAGHAVAAIQVAIPVVEAQRVEVFAVGVKLHRIDLAQRDVRRQLGRGIREMHRDDQAAAGSLRVAPRGETVPERVAEVAFARAARRHGECRSAVTSNQSQVTEQVLAVFGADLDHGLAILGNQRPIGEITDIGEQIAPLGGEQAHQIHSFGLALEHRRRRREKMHVRVGRHPALGAQVHVPLNFELQVTLPGLDGELFAHRAVLEALRHFHVELAHRQLDLKRAVDIGKRTVHQLHIRAIVLKPRVVDFSPMSVRRDIPSIPRPECQPHRRGPARTGIDHLPVQPHLLLFEDLDPGSGGARFEFLAHRRLPKIEFISLAGPGVAENESRFGTCRDFRIEMPGALHRLGALAQALAGRREPGVTVKFRQHEAARHDAQIDFHLPAVFLLRRRLGKCEPVQTQPLVAQRILPPVKQCQTANQERILTHSLESNRLDRLLGAGIGQGGNPESPQRPSAIGAIVHAGLELAPPGAIRKGVRQLAGSVLAMRQSGISQVTPVDRNRIHFEAPPDGKRLFGAVVVNEDRLGQPLAHFLDCVLNRRRSLAWIPVAKGGKAHEAALLSDRDRLAARCRGARPGAQGQPRFPLYSFRAQPERHA